MFSDMNNTYFEKTIIHATILAVTLTIDDVITHFWRH